MENQVLLLSIVRINMNFSTLWIVHEIRNNMEIVNNSFIHEREYEAYVNPLLEICESYVFRSFDVRNSAQHNFDGQLFCPYNYSFEKPESAELFSDCR